MSPLSHAIDLVMLDFDGTLVDSAPDIYRAVCELIDRYKRPHLSFEVVKTHIGEGFSGLIGDVFPEKRADANFQDEMYELFCELYDKHCLKNPILFPGVMDFLKTWPGSVAIVSNKPERFVNKMVKANELSQFNWRAIVGGDTFDLAKPHAEPVNQVLKKCQIKADRAALVGDGLQDVGAALAAKVHGIAVDYGYVKSERLRAIGARHFVSSLVELPQVFQQLASPV